MRLSAGKIWERAARSTAAHPRTPPEAIAFPGPWRIPASFGVDDIRSTYLPKAFPNFKIEGRSLGSALLLEFLLHYLTRPPYHIHVREALYLDNGWTCSDRKKYSLVPQHKGVSACSDHYSISTVMLSVPCRSNSPRYSSIRLMTSS